MGVNELRVDKLVKKHTRKGITDNKAMIKDITGEMVGPPGTDCTLYIKRCEEHLLCAARSNLCLSTRGLQARLQSLKDRGANISLSELPVVCNSRLYMQVTMTRMALSSADASSASLKTSRSTSIHQEISKGQARAPETESLPNSYVSEFSAGIFWDPAGLAELVRAMWGQCALGSLCM